MGVCLENDVYVTVNFSLCLHCETFNRRTFATHHQVHEVLKHNFSCNSHQLKNVNVKTCQDKPMLLLEVHFKSRELVSAWQLLAGHTVLDLLPVLQLDAVMFITASSLSLCFLHGANVHIFSETQTNIVVRKLEKISSIP